MAPFIDLCNVADEISRTPKRLEKARLVGAYLQPLSDDDLRLAVGYLSGDVFPMRDQRRVNVGGSSLFRTLEDVTRVDPAEVRRRLVKLGDLGDLAFVLYEMVPRLQDQPPTLSLAEVAGAFSRLASTSGSRKRLEMLHDLLESRAPGEAKYLVKLLAGDLRIGLKEGALEDALARLFGVQVAHIQWTNMLLGDLGETAVLARHGRLDTARMRLFHPLKFMLATPAPNLDEVARQMPPEFVVEDKYDGIRAQVHVARSESAPHGRTVRGTHVAIFSRTLDDITASFPELVEAFADWEGVDAIFDGEILPMEDGRIRPFAELQKRLGRKELTSEMLASVPVGYVAYDVLYARGEVLLEEPFWKRRQVLEGMRLPPPSLWCTPSQRFTDAQALDAEFAAARARGNEGLMVKDPQSTYKPGRRGREWLKIKRAIATLDVVVTAVEVGHGRRAKFLSDYTFAVRASETDPTLLNVGKAYSGLTDREIGDLSRWFTEHTIEAFGHGRYRLVEPKIVLEVTFDAVQASSRHKSGFALRFPRIVRVRSDKPPEEIDTVETVRRLAGTSTTDAAAER